MLTSRRAATPELLQVGKLRHSNILVFLRFARRSVRIKCSAKMDGVTKAAVWLEPNSASRVEDIEVVDPGAGEVRVAVEAAGVCHSDLHLALGHSARTGFPPFSATKGREWSRRSATG